MSQRNIIIGNWKMNPESLEEAKRIARKTRVTAIKLQNTDVVICPPFPYILACKARKEVGGFQIGAQSVGEFEGGAHTGETSSAILRSLGVKYVIVGHSEEREAGDDDAKVSRKLARVLEGGLTAVVCVGEKVRDENGTHLDFLKQQMKQTFALVTESKVKNVVIAYEPVWAIGATVAMQPDDVYEMSLFVKKVFADLFGQESGLKVKVLYGGSVNFRNAGDIMKIGKVDGLLVGRESVNIPGFIELLKVVDESK